MYFATLIPPMAWSFWSCRVLQISHKMCCNCHSYYQKLPSKQLNHPSYDVKDGKIDLKIMKVSEMHIFRYMGLKFQAFFKIPHKMLNLYTAKYAYHWLPFLAVTDEIFEL